MKMKVLHFWFAIPVLTWLKHVIYVDIILPPDPTVAAPAVVQPTVSTLSSGTVLVLGFLVLAIGSISLVAIRTIKKKHTSADDV